MARYIDADKAKANPQSCFIDGKETFDHYIDSLPTEYVAPVVHGKWLGDDFICSNCKRCLSEIMDADSYYALGFDGTEFCPFCGARIDLEDWNGKSQHFTQVKT